MNFRIAHLGTLLALAGFAACSASLHAANVLTASPATGVQLYCGNAATATITVKPVSGTATIVITLNTLPAGLSVSPSTQTLNSGNSAAGVTFTLSAPTCAGVAAGANTFTLTLKAGGVSDATVAGTINASALTASPASLAITCAYDGTSKYVTSSPQAVTVGASRPPALREYKTRVRWSSATTPRQSVSPLRLPLLSAQRPRRRPPPAHARLAQRHWVWARVRGLRKCLK